MTRRAAAVLSLVVLVGGALAGCVSVPDEGSVQTTGELVPGAIDEVPQIDPPEPKPGESRDEIVRHFLDAMQASPITPLVARQFLSRKGESVWDPDRGVVTYADFSIIQSGSQTVSVELRGVRRLDARGSWLGPVPDRTLSLPMVHEEGEWRIDHVPEDAMIVPETWFEQRYQPASLYFFDPTAQILVPEQVFLPRGAALATNLVRALLLGPPDATATRTFIPARTTLDLSVVVADGVAQVPLRGDLSALPAETLDLMATQLAWTLRQDRSVSLVRVTVDGVPVPMAGGQTEFGVSLGANHDPVGAAASPALYGLRNGRALEVIDDVELPVTGPFGTRTRGVVDLSADLTALSLAGVTRDRRTVYVGPVSETDGRAPEPVLKGASNVLHPAWDVQGRLWLVDRRTPGAGGARVSVVRKGALEAVPFEVPGITGEQVIDFLVSRDGTRIVAALDGAAEDVVVAARIVSDETGRPVAASPAREVLRGEGGEKLAIRDLGWRSPTSFLYVTALTDPDVPAAGQLSEIRSTPLDGSPAPLEQAEVSEVLRGVVTRVVSSPRIGDAIFAEDASGVLTPFPSTAGLPPPGLTALTYVG